MAGPRRPKTARNHHEGDSPANESLFSAYSILSHWKVFTGFFILAIALYMGALGYLETRVNTPFFGEKVIQDTGLDVPERYWGTYRPQLYFGIKSRDPKSPLFGLMWYDVRKKTPIRHWCKQEDNVKKYAYEYHDAASFGIQTIVDGDAHIVTSFVNQPSSTRGGHWTARINVTGEPIIEPISNKTNEKGDIYEHLQISITKIETVVSLFWYVALDESQGPNDSYIALRDNKVVGYTPELGTFEMTFTKLNGQEFHYGVGDAHADRVDTLLETLHRTLQVGVHDNLGTVFVLTQDKTYTSRKGSNFVVFQSLFPTPATFEIVFRSLDFQTPPLQGASYAAVLQDRKNHFIEEFENKFHLTERKYVENRVQTGMTALSSMLGGIGYFYGAGKVQSQYTKEPVPYWKSALYTAVPSRSFFPRGFLWDEGFHGLLISKWNPDIFMDIAGHWLDLMNVEGWIPREQILGLEALARVPKEFVVQSNTAANPPMLLITIARLVQKRPELFGVGGKHRAALQRMFPRLQAWLQWFQTTQRGMEPTSYMWHGRDDTKEQLIPLTLSSGLDDYPRASHASGLERHVDLRCWLYAAAAAMDTVATALDVDNRKYEAMRDQLGDEKLLNQLHWSEEKQMYADYGLHTDAVRLVRSPPERPGSPGPPGPPRVTRAVGEPPQPSFVTSAFGYVSLFPLLLKVLSPQSDKLGVILNKLDDPELLWSPYGLRSLSTKSPYYMKPNSGKDPPYWRGQVWVNINYLALSALKHYADVGGPHAERARELHKELKKNVVRMICVEYNRTGYFWEQYSDSTGRGSGCRPFSGWTALLPLIMAEDY